MPFPRSRALVMAILAILLAGALWWSGGLFGQVDDTPVETAAKDDAKPVVGLMGTLPIYWGEVADIDEMLSGGGQSHWARAALEREYRLQPLDTLDPDGGIEKVDYLLLAQPRALSGPENVSLDKWVRAGGRLLVFADPFLSGESRFHIGDRRRPQDVVLISPILARWGLELQFDTQQPDGDRKVPYKDSSLPVNLAGEFALRDPAGGAPSDCTLQADGLVAQCEVGEGRVLLVADATVLENGAQEGGRSTALDALVSAAFDTSRTGSGNSRD